MTFFFQWFIMYTRRPPRCTSDTTYTRIRNSLLSGEKPIAPRKRIIGMQAVKINRNVILDPHFYTRRGRVYSHHLATYLLFDVPGYVLYWFNQLAASTVAVNLTRFLFFSQLSPGALEIMPYIVRDVRCAITWGLKINDGIALNSTLNLLWPVESPAAFPDPVIAWKYWFQNVGWRCFFPLYRKMWVIKIFIVGIDNHIRLCR